MTKSEHLNPEPKTQDATVTRIVETDSVLELQTGVVILERFRVVELLGRGGMGTVYKVEDIETGTIYALKFLHKQHTNDATWRRFDIEAKTANKLDHPNLIKVHESGLLPDGQPFFIMDLVPGESLAQILRARGRLTLNQAAKIFIQVGFALSYAHANGVIHRDIKPSNIMLQKQDNDTSLGVVKVVDFGIAKLTGQDEFTQQTLTKTGEIFGSPLYMSPEQCMGITVDHRSDLYSLGCVFYEALTGAPPLVGESALSTMMKHQSESALSLKEASLGIEFPQQIEHIVGKLLAKGIHDRYQSAQLFTADLVNFDSGLNNNLLTFSRPQAAQEKTVLNWNVAALGLLFACVFHLGIAFGYLLPHEIQRSSPLRVPEGIFGTRSGNDVAVKEVEDFAHKQFTANFFNDNNRHLSTLEKQPGYFSTIDAKRNLRIFHFPEFEVGNIGESERKQRVARGIVQFPLIHSLYFSPTDMFRRHPLLFKKFRPDDIETLWLRNRRVDMNFEKFEFSDVNEVLKNITHFRKLHSLYFVSTKLSPQAWSLVSNFPELHALGLSHVDLSTAEIAKFKRFKQLTYFKIIVPEKISLVLEQLRGSKKLDNLCLTSCPLSESDLRIIGTMTNLTSLDLRGTKLTDAAIPLLPPSLVKLDVRGCKITPAGIDSFRRLKNLRSLSIDLDEFSNEVKYEFANTLKNVQIKVYSEMGDPEELVVDRK